MANLKGLSSFEIAPEGQTIEVGPGKVGVRSHRRLQITTDGQIVFVQPNVETFIETKSGSLAVDPLSPATAIEVWPIVAEVPVGAPQAIEAPPK